MGGTSDCILLWLFLLFQVLITVLTILQCVGLLAVIMRPRSHNGGRGGGCFVLL